MRKLAWFTVTFILFSTQAALAKDITIGLTLGLTNKYAKTASHQKNAYKLWQDKVNQQGGLLGRKVKFIIYDDKSNKKTAKKLYEKLITEDKVDIVLGPYASSITLAVAPIAEKYGMPMLAAGASNDAIWAKGHKNVFGIWRPASRYTQGFMELVLTYGLDNLAIITEDDGFAKNAFKGAKKWASILDLETVHTEMIKKGNRNLVPLASRIKASGAQAVVLLGHYNESVDMRKAFKKIGWYPQAYIATVGPANKKYQTELQQDAEHSFSVANWEPHDRLKFQGSKEFKNKYKSRFGLIPSYQGAGAYAAGQILEAVLSETRSLDKDKIRRAMANLETTTIQGRYGVDRTGMQTKHFPLITQWIDGKKEIVWPKKLQTAQPRFGLPRQR